MEETSLRLIYGYLSPPISGDKPSTSAKLLGSDRKRVHPFVRTYRIEGITPENAIARCDAQWRFLYQQKILLSNLPGDARRRRQYLNLEKMWMQLTGGGDRKPTHFIECGIIISSIRNKDRIPYNPGKKMRRRESMFFKGAFCFAARDRDPDHIARIISHLLLGGLESDFADYDGAALSPTRAWILQRIMSGWKAINQQIKGAE